MRLIGLLLASLLPLSAQTLSQWSGGTSQNWDDATNWTTLTVPCNTGPTTYNVFIGGGAGTVNMPSSCTIESFEMQLGAELTMDNGVSLTIRETATNHGLIAPTSTGAGTGLFLSDISGDDKVLLTGTGELRLDHAEDRISGTTSDILVHDASHNIKGHGKIGTSQLNVENAGIIVADSPGNILQLLPRTTFDHTGFLLASDGGILQFNAATYTAQPGSTIQVNDNSEIHLNGPTIVDGFFEAGDNDLNLNNNIVRITTNTTLKGTDNQAHIIIDDARTLTFDGDDVSNDGLFTPDSTGGATGLHFQDTSDLNIALGGTGTINLDHPSERITGASAHTLTHNSPHLIQGGGNIGLGQLNIINRSTITANHATPLTLAPRTSWLNDGGKVIVEAGATAIANAATYTSQGGGLFQIGDSSELTLNGPTIIDSAFQPDDVDLDLTNNLVHVITSSTLNNCINNANLRIDNGRTLNLTTGDFTNNTSLHLDGTANPTSLHFSDANDLEIQLLGTGTIFLDNPSDRISGSAAHFLRHGQDHTIEGSGTIGASQINLINHGIIDANRTAETLTLSPRTSFHNDGGIVRCTNGGILHLNPATYTAANGGIYIIDDLCLTELDGGTYQNLTFDINDLDLIPTNNDINVLTNTTLQGVTNEADLSVNDGRTLTLSEGDFTNNAEIRLNSTGSPTSLLFSDPSDLSITLLGNGTIFLDSPDDRITGSSAHFLTIGPDQTIEGFGKIGLTSINLLNQGYIDANVPAEQIDLAPRTSFVNDGGTIHARNGGTLACSGGSYSSTNGGSYRIFDNSAFTLTSVNFSDLSLDVDNTDTILDNNAVTVLTNSTFNNVVNNAAITIDNGRILFITPDGITNNGTITLDSTGGTTQIVVSGGPDLVVSIGGSGRILLDNSDEWLTGSGNHFFIHEANHTIEGAGRVGTASIQLDNRGTISANLPAQSLTIDDRSNSFPNTGTMQAVNGATLDVRDAVFHQAGLIFAEAGSLATFTGAIIQTGGTTRVDGELTTDAFDLQGGTLHGIGTVNGSLNTTNALVSPGNSTGTLTLNDGAFLATGSSLKIEINATADSDQLLIAGGNLDISQGALQLVYTGGPTDVMPTDIFTIVNVTSPPPGGNLSGQFINVAHGQRLNTIDGSASFEVSYAGPTVTLTDFVYNPSGATNLDPVFTTTTTTYNVAENTAPGTGVASFHAYDPEGGSITYSLTAGQPFAINPSTGALSVSGPLDWETQTSYNLDVTASDGTTQTLLSITVDIDNVIENNQEFVTLELTSPGGPFPGETDLNIIGVDADPDGDGHQNIFELWRGTDPGTADQPAPLVLEEYLLASINRGSVSLATVSAMDNALAIDVEISHDALTWRDITTNRSVLGVSGGTRFLRFHDSIALPADTPFFVRFLGDPLASP